MSEKPQRLRKISSSSSANTSKDGGGSADEFFIDMILARHARKLLTRGNLTDLGRFSVHLDFYLVSWLRLTITNLQYVMKEFYYFYVTQLGTNVKGFGIESN